MTMFYLILATVIVSIATALYIARFKIRNYLHHLSIKMQLGTLRTAIHDADDDKAKSKRKNIVVFNTDSKSFEPVQKRLLKFVAKNKVQKEVPDGYRRPAAYRKKKRPLDLNRVKEIEKESLYVTQ